jgi:hypothetical protein
MLVYAVADDLVTGNWVQEAPANADALLRKASGLVRRATRAALYDVDGAGKPSDPATLQAFKDATCAQAAAWIEAGIDPGSLPKPSVVASKSMGDRSVAYADAPQVAEKSRSLADDLADEAYDILADAGLLNGQPSLWGNYAW